MSQSFVPTLATDISVHAKGRDRSQFEVTRQDSPGRPIVLRLTGNPDAQTTVGVSLFLDDESLAQLTAAITKFRRSTR
jgi:hypothetical protein